MRPRFPPDPALCLTAPPRPLTGAQAGRPEGVHRIRVEIMFIPSVLVRTNERPLGA